MSSHYSVTQQETVERSVDKPQQTQAASRLGNAHKYSAGLLPGRKQTRHRVHNFSIPSNRPCSRHSAITRCHSMMPLG